MMSALPDIITIITYTHRRGAHLMEFRSLRPPEEILSRVTLHPAANRDVFRRGPPRAAE